MKRSVRLLLAISLVLPLLLSAVSLAAQDAAPERDWYLGKILFKSTREGGEAIYAMNPDGSDIQRVDDPNVGFYYAEAQQRDSTTGDGRYRLFVRTVGGDTQIWQEDTQTGWLSYIIGGTDGADYDPVWASDSRYVAYVSQVDANDEIHLFDRQTGYDKRLTRNTWEWDKRPSFSPDGTQIVFWSNRESEWKHIWIMSQDGSSQTNLSGWGRWNDWDPVWVKQVPSQPTEIDLGGGTPVLERGPACQPQPEDYVGKIVFKSDREGTVAFFMLDPQSGDICRVDDPNVGFYYTEAKERGSISSDGRYRLFVRIVGGDNQIWQEEIGTGVVAYVVGGVEGADYDPVWAADSRYVAYVSQADGNDEIYVYDRTTRAEKRLTDNTWEWDKHPFWSPDGTQIVFFSNRETQYRHLWLMNADGSGQRNVSGSGRFSDYDPVWFSAVPSPAPELPVPTPGPTAVRVEPQVMPRDWYVGRILFKSDRGGAEAFYSMLPDGSDVQLASDPNIGYYYAEAVQRDTLSADGRYRLFVNRIGNDDQVWQEDVVSHQIAYVVGGVQGADYEPVWAPDTRFVAYVSQVDGNDEIHLYDRRDNFDKRLTTNTWEWDKHPTFSLDGAKIVFYSNRESRWKHVWIMGADGSGQTNLSGWGEWNDWDPVWVKQVPSER